MHIQNLGQRHANEARRQIQLNKYEHTDSGIYIPKMGLNIAGQFETSINGGPWDIDANMVVTEGLNHIVGVALAQATQKTAFYIALQGGDVAVAATWTGANYTANATEFTAYDEATRVLWVDGSVSAGAVSNTASPAVFTISANSSVVRGAALMEASAKSATTGVLVCAARFSADKTLDDDEELRVKYTITATSA